MAPPPLEKTTNAASSTDILREVTGEEKEALNAQLGMYKWDEWRADKMTAELVKMKTTNDKQVWCGLVMGYNKKGRTKAIQS